MNKKFLRKPHPWHGIASQHDDQYINCFIEIVPSDSMKYELDKQTGYLMIDRPNLSSSTLPTPYGFIPRTFCGDLVGGEKPGDKDPLDVCVLMEGRLNHGDLLLKARPIGGFRMVDRGEADDKIITVLKGDPIYGDIQDVLQVPQPVLDKLHHYFVSYKRNLKGESDCYIEEVYGREEARKVIQSSQLDYKKEYE